MGKVRVLKPNTAIDTILNWNKKRLRHFFSNKPTNRYLMVRNEMYLWWTRQSGHPVSKWVVSPVGKSTRNWNFLNEELRTLVRCWLLQGRRDGRRRVVPLFREGRPAVPGHEAARRRGAAARRLPAVVRRRRLLPRHPVPRRRRHLLVRRQARRRGRRVPRPRQTRLR